MPPLQEVATELLAAESRLTTLDQAVGDGDLGVSMSRAAGAILENLERLSAQPAALALTNLSHIMRRVIGRELRPLLCRRTWTRRRALEAERYLSPVLGRRVEGACDAISELGGAAKGDRTMLDALYPAAAAFRGALERGAPLTEAMQAAVTAAEEAHRETAKLMPRRGRSAYLGARAIGSPDPGAEAVAVWLRAISDSINS